MNDLVKQFGDSLAVDHVNIDIKSGEFVTLLGPSGCGKTTILSMILGIIEPTSGSISFDGEPINGMPMNRRDIGMVFQNYALFPHMTVAENVGFGLDMRKLPKAEKKQRIKDALEMVQLSEFASRFPKQLSGGQQQRVALARALVIRPRVLLLDEPLSNLDAKLRKEMRIQLKRLHEELGITTIYVTHDQEEALSLSTKVAVMSKGVVQQIGTPQEIFQKPKNQFVANFIGYGNFLSGKIAGERDGHYVFETETGLSLLVKKDLRFNIRDKAVVTIKPENIKIVEPTHPSSNLLKGKVIVSDYAGNTTAYEVKTDDKSVWKVNVLGLDPYDIYDNITLYLDPEKLLLLDKE
ncbi:polyamine ABC transporter ATP-binding protein [Bacillus sp. V3-13]|nr:polyamine ABC transporter ATP-binding protein [Bacillus sp. V3-13]